MTDEMRTCPGCGRQVSAAYNVCPYCGRPANAPQPNSGQQTAYVPQPDYGPLPVAVPVGGILTFLMYLTSLFFSPFGLMIGALWLGLGADREKQKIGKNCLILGIVGIIIMIVLVLVALAYVRGSVING
jgi:hypothetical protein